MPTKVKKKLVKKPVKKSAKKKTSKKSNNKKVGKTFIALIVDKSGSMSSIRAEAIEHFNEQIEKIKEESKDINTYVTLVLFNHDVETKFFNQSVDRLEPLTMRTYTPDGMTAMYDAVGKTIDRMQNEIPELKNKDNAALVVVLSDGCENSSKNYTQADIAERVQKFQDTKRWTFAYLGANQDLSVVTDKLNIPRGNVSAFVATKSGMARATGMSVNSTRSYLQSRRIGSTQTQSYYTPKK